MCCPASILDLIGELPGNPQVVILDRALDSGADCIYLLVDSSAIIRDNTKGQAHSASRSYQLAAAGIGLITVLYLLLRLLFGAESSLITCTILSLGLSLSGLVFLISIVATHYKQAVRTRDIVASLLKILVAAVFLITPPGVMLRLIAFVALYIGVVQVVNAVILLRRGTKTNTDPRYSLDCGNRSVYLLR